MCISEVESESGPPTHCWMACFLFTALPPTGPTTTTLSALLIFIPLTALLMLREGEAKNHWYSVTGKAGQKSNRIGKSIDRLTYNQITSLVSLHPPLYRKGQKERKETKREDRQQRESSVTMLPWQQSPGSPPDPSAATGLGREDIAIRAISLLQSVYYM